MFKTFSKITTTLGLASLLVAGLGFSGGVKAEAATNDLSWPWKSGQTRNESANWGYHRYNTVNGNPFSFPSLDIHFSGGEEILAMSSGNIISNKSCRGSSGNNQSYLTIDHGNGLQVVYAHLRADSVNTSSRNVRKGEVIGRMASGSAPQTPANCNIGSGGSHLHLGFSTLYSNPLNVDGFNLAKANSFQNCTISGFTTQCTWQYKDSVFTSRNSTTSSPAPVPTPNPAPSGNVARIKAYNNKNFCLDLNGNNQSQNARINLSNARNCTGNNAAQQFLLPNGMTTSTNSGQGQIRLAANPTYCLDFDGLNTSPKAGLNTLLSKCNNGIYSSSEWKFYPNGTIRPVANTNFCLSNYSNRLVNLNQTGLWNCNGNGSSDQIWYWE